MASFGGRSGRRVALEAFCALVVLMLLGVWSYRTYPEVVSRWASICLRKLGLPGIDGDGSGKSLGAYVPGLLYNTPYLGGEDSWLDAK
jgi:hypothetical protein